MTYIGRFAPSPSGALHFGSLVAALGSYLQARANQGLWLVRIEDIDPPREVPGAADEILRTLESFGLHWDRTVLYQHTRHAAYQAQIDAWLASGEAYFCQCTRKQIQAVGGYYQGQCRHANHGAENSAVRLQLSQPVTEFDDLKHGTLTIPKALATEDFIIKRRDGLFAYNLAVVLDDIEQGITEVVRGADLIEPTGRQISLYRQLNIAPVRYLHLPLALNQLGNKLSKQNHAPAVERHNPVPALVEALAFLNHPIPHAMQGAGIQELLNWAVAHWQVSRLPNTTALITSF